MMAAIVILFYGFPTILAWDRKHVNLQAIFVLNLFLGWTILGWIAALIWACTAQRKEA